MRYQAKNKKNVLSREKHRSSNLFEKIKQYMMA